MEPSSAPPAAGTSIAGSVATEQADVLAAMLRIAEGEIKAKDEQHGLLTQIIATNEKELAGKDRRIRELEARVGSLNDDIDQYKRLFDRYLSKTEAARASSVFQPRQKGTDEELLAGSVGSDAFETGGAPEPVPAPHTAHPRSPTQRQLQLADQRDMAQGLPPLNAPPPPARSPPQAHGSSSARRLELDRGASVSSASASPSRSSELRGEDLLGDPPASLPPPEPPRRVLPGRPDDEIALPPNALDDGGMMDATERLSVAASSVQSSVDQTRDVAAALADAETGVPATRNTEVEHQDDELL